MDRENGRNPEREPSEKHHSVVVVVAHAGGSLRHSSVGYAKLCAHLVIKLDVRGTELLTEHLAAGPCALAGWRLQRIAIRHPDPRPPHRKPRGNGAEKRRAEHDAR